MYRNVIRRWKRDKPPAAPVERRITEPWFDGAKFAGGAGFGGAEFAGKRASADHVQLNLGVSSRLDGAVAVPQVPHNMTPAATAMASTITAPSQFTGRGSGYFRRF